jgi:chaperonin GroEL (HSP60 family)
VTYEQALFRSEARDNVLRGVNALADAVRVTLGPRSKCVLVERRFGVPLVCNDGVTIAREMTLRDPNENPGAQMIRQAAERTGDAVGDGTSTATILAQAIFVEGVRNVVAGASAIDLDWRTRSPRRAAPADRGDPDRGARGEEGAGDAGPGVTVMPGGLRPTARRGR